MATTVEIANPHEDGTVSWITLWSSSKKNAISNAEKRSYEHPDEVFRVYTPGRMAKAKSMLFQGGAQTDDPIFPEPQDWKWAHHSGLGWRGFEGNPRLTRRIAIEKVAHEFYRVHPDYVTRLTCGDDVIYLHEGKIVDEERARIQVKYLSDQVDRESRFILRGYQHQTYDGRMISPNVYAALKHDGLDKLAHMIHGYALDIELARKHGNTTRDLRDRMSKATELLKQAAQILDADAVKETD